MSTTAHAPRKGDRILFASRIDDRVLEGFVVSARQKRGAILVQADAGAKFWRRPCELLTLGRWVA